MNWGRPFLERVCFHSEVEFIGKPEQFGISSFGSHYLWQCLANIKKEDVIVCLVRQLGFYYPYVHNEHFHAQNMIILFKEAEEWLQETGLQGFHERVAQQDGIPLYACDPPQAPGADDNIAFADDDEDSEMGAASASQGEC